MYESTALGEQTLSPVLLCPARHWPCHQVHVLSTGPQQPCSTSRKKKRAAPCAPGACNSGRYAALGIFSTQRKRWQLILRLVNFPCNTPALSPSCDPSCYRLLFCWNASFHLFIRPFLPLSRCWGLWCRPAFVNDNDASSASAAADLLVIDPPTTFVHSAG